VYVPAEENAASAHDCPPFGQAVAVTAPAPVASGEDRLANLVPGLDPLDVPVCMLDRERRYRYAGAGYLALRGKPIEALVGRTPGEVFGACSWC
jgi:hypothetical protein